MIFGGLKKSATITTSQQLQNALGVGWSTPAGVSVDPKTAIRFAPVYQCIRVLAESIGMMPLHLYEQKGETKTKALGHSLYGLLHDAPNDFQTSQEWREMMIAHLCLRGNFYCWINRVNSKVVELLPLQPDVVKPKQHNDWSVTYQITFPGGETRTVPAEEILHVRLMTLDGLVGLSPIAQAKNTIGLGLAAEKFGSQLFGNGSRPSGILSTEKNITDKQQLDLIKEQWDGANGSEQLRTAILSGGLEWTAISINPEEAQFLETRGYQRTEIAGLFRVPPHMIGDLTKTTVGNVEQQAIDFVTHSLMPIYTRIEQRIKVSLLTDQERNTLYAKFNVNGLLRGDMKTRGEFYWRQFQMGALSSNEIREFEDRNPVEGGDAYWVPSNMMDPEKADQLTGLPKPKLEEGSEESDDE